MEQLSNLVISDKELLAISSMLAKLMQDTSASYVMLLDKSGQVIATQSQGNMQRDCIVTDISDGGVRLRIDSADVPDEFVLLLAEDGYSYKERAYQVVWRLGPELGAKFLGQTRRGTNRAANLAKG